MILTRAPLRIPLGGGGTDFPSFYRKYGGYILGFAIQRYVYVVLHKTSDKKYNLKYSKSESSPNLDLLENRVAAEALRFYNIPPGIEISTFSDVPESSGLGGSTSFCVALVLALRHSLHLPCAQNTLFVDSYAIERVKANQPGGFQDQYFATQGGAYEVEFSDVFFSPRRVDNEIERCLPYLRLVFAGVGDRRLHIARTQESRTLEGDDTMVKSLLTVKDLGRRVKQVIADGNYDELGRIFDQHWASKKARDPNITTPEIDKLYAEGLKLGATGGKLIGMGGGGYILFCGKALPDAFPGQDLYLDKEGASILYSSGSPVKEKDNVSNSEKNKEEIKAPVCS
jgi:D-glycero-alpha-D-manno-heptose-7-phosphate kinase